MDRYADYRHEEYQDLRTLVSLLGTFEAQMAAEHYLLNLFLYTEMNHS